ncbi:alpha/beta-hydrolase [Violaceomyces palustris]|uniref:Alpha/beta-hydrolase n=1 Tax=Violaceomyces palustris TaxID=1673888 RepID=A0ACD0P1P1_9BASI|nr:alpha/beta-hydrolase [Violaceomyces palustris]
MEQASEAKPFCIHCVSGDIIPGTPRGTEQTIGPYKVYVTHPSSGAPADPAKVIVSFTDVFGLELVNNKIIPDLIADQTGFTVYVPDMFHGDSIAQDAVKGMPSTAKEAKAQSFLTKVTKFLSTLKEESGAARIGAVGYCYGGKSCLVFNARGLVDVSVACHPSFINLSDIKSLKGPVLFNCAEQDDVFPTSLRESGAKALGDRHDAPPHEFKVYENTVHGFAARPNLAEPLVKKAFEEALEATASWLKAHL